MGIAAVNTGNNLIYLLVAALLSFLAISGIFGRFNIKNLRISFLSPDEIYAGCETPLFVHLHNDRRHYPAFLLNLRTSRDELIFPFIFPRGMASALYRWTGNERGLHPLPALPVASPFPFGFFIRYQNLPMRGQQLIVFPHPRRGPFRDGDNINNRSRGDTVREESGYEGEIISVRDYQPGDPLRFIHWKASARTGGLKTKDFGLAAAEPLLLDFASLPGRDQEAKLSHLCFLIKDSLPNTRPVGLKLGGEIFGPGHTREHKLKMLRALAVYQGK